MCGRGSGEGRREDGGEAGAERFGAGGSWETWRPDQCTGACFVGSGGGGGSQHD